MGQVAMSNGRRFAEGRRQEGATQMTPTEIAEAERLVRGWKWSSPKESVHRYS